MATKTKSPKFTWRKGKKSSCVDLSISHELFVDKVHYGTVESRNGSWYFYAHVDDFTINTIGSNLSLDQAKAKCRAWVEKHLAYEATPEAASARAKAESFEANMETIRLAGTVRDWSPEQAEKIAAFILELASEK